jgi:hypothetical protein
METDPWRHVGEERQGLQVRRMQGGEMKREKELIELLKEAAEFLRSRGLYYYGHERRGPAAGLLERIEKATGEKP